MMEWFGEKMLPNGLPNLIYQIVPAWLSRKLKIVTHSRKAKRGLKGQIGYHDGSYRMNLYPTVVLFHARGPGVLAFQYWRAVLKTFLHEIGHVMTADKYRNIREWQYKQIDNVYLYVEQLADNWCYETMDKIGQRHPRLGQPKGWIGGLSGAYILDTLKRIKRENKYPKYKVKSIQNYRAYTCGGQLSLSDLVDEICYNLQPSYCPRTRNKVRSTTKKIAMLNGLHRTYVDGAGRNHLFFNYGEFRLLTKLVCRWFENEGKHVLEELEKPDAVVYDGEDPNREVPF